MTERDENAEYLRKKAGVASEASLTLVGRASRARNSSVLKLWGPRAV